MSEVSWDHAATAFRDIPFEDRPQYFEAVTVYDGTLHGCVEVLRDMPQAERREIYIETVDEPFRRFDGAEIEVLISALRV